MVARTRCRTPCAVSRVVSRKKGSLRRGGGSGAWHGPDFCSSWLQIHGITVQALWQRCNAEGPRAALFLPLIGSTWSPHLDPDPVPHP